MQQPAAQPAPPAPPVRDDRHVCETCRSTFRRASHLKRHQKLHTGIKDHVCQHCSRAFMRQDNLKRHIRSYHLHAEAQAGAVPEDGAPAAEPATPEEVEPSPRSSTMTVNTTAPSPRDSPRASPSTADTASPTVSTRGHYFPPLQTSQPSNAASAQRWAEGEDSKNSDEAPSPVLSDFSMAQTIDTSVRSTSYLSGNRDATQPSTPTSGSPVLPPNTWVTFPRTLTTTGAYGHPSMQPESPRHRAYGYVPTTNLGDGPGSIYQPPLISPHALNPTAPRMGTAISRAWMQSPEAAMLGIPPAHLQAAAAAAAGASVSDPLAAAAAAAAAAASVAVTTSADWLTHAATPLPHQHPHAHPALVSPAAAAAALAMAGSQTGYHYDMQDAAALATLEALNPRRWLLSGSPAQLVAAGYRPLSMYSDQLTTRQLPPPLAGMQAAAAAAAAAAAVGGHVEFKEEDVV